MSLSTQILHVNRRVSLDEAEGTYFSLDGVVIGPVCLRLGGGPDRRADADAGTSCPCHAAARANANANTNTHADPSSDSDPHTGSYSHRDTHTHASPTTGQGR